MAGSDRLQRTVCRRLLRFVTETNAPQSAILEGITALGGRGEVNAADGLLAVGLTTAKVGLETELRNEGFPPA